jgi:hypothetical protein
MNKYFEMFNGCIDERVHKEKRRMSRAIFRGIHR